LLNLVSLNGGVLVVAKSVIPAFEDGGMLALFVEPSTSE
jgi:hypothetical protein